MSDIEKRLRDYADNPTASGLAPVHPDTLREAADEIERLRSEYDHLNGLWRKLLEEAREAGHVNTEETDFGYLLMSLRMGPPDRYRAKLDRIQAAAEYAIEVLEGGGKSKDAIAALRDGMGAAHLQSRVANMAEAEANRVTTDDAPDEMAPVECSIWVMGYKAALEWISREFRP